MENRRVQKVETELRNIIANYVLTSLKQPLACLASVTHVRVSPDFRYGKVYISLFGEDKLKNQDWEVLLSQTSHIQRHVGHSIRLKFTPRLQFFLDTASEKMDKIEKILSEIRPHKSHLVKEGENEI